MTRAVKWTNRVLDLEGQSRVNFRRARHMAELTLEQAAERISVTTGIGDKTVRNTLKRYEGGSGGMSMSVLTAAADVYDVSADYLHGRTQAPEAGDEAARFGCFNRALMAKLMHFAHSATEQVFLGMVTAQPEEYAQIQQLMLKAAQQIRSVRAANQQLFDDEFKGGSNLLKMADQFDEQARIISCTLKKQQEALAYHHRVISDEVLESRKQCSLGLFDPLQLAEDV